MPILVYAHTILMKLAFLQIPLAWEAPKENRLAIESYLQAEDLSEVDIVVLPETFTTGFSMRAIHLAESMEQSTIPWMMKVSEDHGILLAGSIMIKEAEKVYNRFVVVDSSRVLAQYDKKHLFGLGAEKELITAGSERVSFPFNKWKINLQICYDLRFPVWMRNTDSVDLILIVANWPAPRVQAWRSLLVARAIENQCFVVGVNRLGVDGNGLDYTGDSLVVDPTGNILLDAGSKPGMYSIELDYDFIADFRNKFPFLKDADQFNLK
jgi:omega-amidase